MERSKLTASTTPYENPEGFEESKDKQTQKNSSSTLQPSISKHRANSPLGNRTSIEWKQYKAEKSSQTEDPYGTPTGVNPQNTKTDNNSSNKPNYANAVYEYGTEKKIYGTEFSIKDLYQLGTSKQDADSQYAPENLYSEVPTLNKKVDEKEDGYGVETPLSSPRSNGSTEDKDLSDWNGKFQELIDLNDSREKFERIRDLASDFSYCAQTYGVIIISELGLPLEEKTIKPIKIGGIAGGEKYIVRGILFKFAVDEKGLYGGDENAQKSAGHDLNGLMQYLNCGIDGLHFPLMCLVDYRGFRLVALSILPITRDTIIYGSSDAGINVQAEEESLNQKMERVAKIMNSKGHMVGRVSPKLIYGPGDIEGHKGTDGRFYLIDFARYCPPEPPKQGLRGANLYRLLRPELVKKFPNPLSADGFSNIGSHDSQIHNTEIREAFEYLQVTCIPECAAAIQQEAENIVSTLHKFGINLRYLGLVRTLMDPTSTGSNKLLIEMVIRTLKANICKMQRTYLRSIGIPAEMPYIKIVVDNLNAILDAENKDAWDILVKDVQDKYEKSIYPDEDAQAIRSKVLHDIPVFFKKFQSLTGIKISKSALREIENGRSSTLLCSDIKKMDSKNKQLNWIDYADGMALYLTAMESIHIKDAAVRQLKVAKEKLARSLNSFSSIETFFQLGKVSFELAKLGGSLTHHYEEVTKHFDSVLKMDPSNYECLAAYGRVYKIVSKGSSIKSASEFIEKAIEKYNQALQIRTAHSTSFSGLLSLYVLKAKGAQTDDARKEILIEGSKIAETAVFHKPKDANIQFKAGLLSFKYSLLLKDDPANKTEFDKQQTESCARFASAISSNPSFIRKFKKHIQDGEIAFLLTIASDSDFLLSKLFTIFDVINFNKVSISDKENEKLLEWSKNNKITSISINDCSGLKNSTLLAMSGNLQELVKLVLTKQSLELVTSDTIFHILQKATKLVSLNLSESKADDTCFHKLQTSEENPLNLFPMVLKSLDLSATHISIEAVKQIAHLWETQLQDLSIGKNNLPTEISPYIGKLVNLKTLNIGGLSISIADLTNILLNCKVLTELNTHECGNLPNNEVLVSNRISTSLKKLICPNGVITNYTGTENFRFIIELFHHNKVVCRHVDTKNEICTVDKRMDNYNLTAPTINGTHASLYKMTTTVQNKMICYLTINTGFEPPQLVLKKTLNIPLNNMMAIINFTEIPENYQLKVLKQGSASVSGIELTMDGKRVASTLERNMRGLLANSTITVDVAACSKNLDVALLFALIYSSLEVFK